MGLTYTILKPARLPERYNRYLTSGPEVDVEVLIKETAINSNSFEKGPAGEVQVWDPVVRIFHWSLVASFAVAYLTGEDESRLHELTGYVVVGLVLFRVINWGIRRGIVYITYPNWATICRTGL
jgi:hypothetical protein